MADGLAVIAIQIVPAVFNAFEAAGFVQPFRFAAKVAGMFVAGYEFDNGVIGIDIVMVFR